MQQNRLKKVATLEESIQRKMQYYYCKFRKIGHRRIAENDFIITSEKIPYSIPSSKVIALSNKENKTLYM